jgi:hypothetical protein
MAAVIFHDDVGTGSQDDDLVVIETSIEEESLEHDKTNTKA